MSCTRIAVYRPEKFFAIVHFEPFELDFFLVTEAQGGSAA